MSTRRNVSNSSGTNGRTPDPLRCKRPSATRRSPWGAITACSTWIAAQAPFLWLAMLPRGIPIIFFLTFGHECAYTTPFRTPWLNEVVGHMASVPPMLPFRWFHPAHHRHTNDPDRDPKQGPHPETMTSPTLHLSGLGYWNSAARIVVSNNACDHTKTPYLHSHSAGQCNAKRVRSSLHICLGKSGLQRSRPHAMDRSRSARTTISASVSADSARPMPIDLQYARKFTG